MLKCKQNNFIILLYVKQTLFYLQFYYRNIGKPIPNFTDSFILDIFIKNIKRIISQSTV